MTKSILFATKFKKKIIKKLNIKNKDIKFKQHFTAKYLECLLDKTRSVEAMAPEIINEINNKLTFLHRKIVFDTSSETPAS